MHKPNNRKGENKEMGSVELEPLCTFENMHILLCNTYCMCAAVSRLLRLTSITAILLTGKDRLRISGGATLLRDVQ